jgi:hypothetical protein
VHAQTANNFRAKLKNCAYFTGVFVKLAFGNPFVFDKLWKALQFKD